MSSGLCQEARLARRSRARAVAGVFAGTARIFACAKNLVNRRPENVLRTPRPRCSPFAGHFLFAPSLLGASLLQEKFRAKARSNCVGRNLVLLFLPERAAARTRLKPTVAGRGATIRRFPVKKVEAMKRLTLVLPFLLLALCPSRASLAQDASAPRPSAQTAQTPAPVNTTSPVSAAEAEKWREDLRFMASEAERRHKNLFHTVTRAEFAAAVRRLDERIPRLARHQIIVELARIMASVGDGHTNVAPTRDPRIGFRTLPARLYLFRDGLFVRAARKDHADLVGARVLKVGSAPADEAIRRAGEIIGQDNEMGVKFFAPHLLAIPEVLHALGITEDLEAARFTVERAGRQREVVLKPAGPADLLPPDTDTTWIRKEGWVDMRDGATAPTPLWLRDPDNKFWFEYLKDSRTVYAQLNQVNNKADETLADFSKKLFAFVEANPVDRLVLDLRLNRGGNGMLRRPLVVGLIKSKVDAPGRLFVLMGRGTWSAAQFLLNDLESYTNAIFVGEPSASKGNAFGDSRRITLPHSGVTARVSVYWWQDWSPWDTRRWTAPHVTAEMTSSDYRANVDPALRAALSYTPQRPLAELLNEALDRGDLALAVRRYRDFRAEPAHLYHPTDRAMIDVGLRLIRQKKFAEAVELLRLNAEANPDSPDAHALLGDALMLGGDKDAAARHFERALALHPQNAAVADRLRQLRQK
jgi:tetratricopeptide (TPR) repeat protein